MRSPLRLKAPLPSRAKSRTAKSSFSSRIAAVQGLRPRNGSDVKRGSRLRDHRGVHPRVGAIDVVPFVPLCGATMRDAIAALEASPGLRIGLSPAKCLSCWRFRSCEDGRVTRARHTHLEIDAKQPRVEAEGWRGDYPGLAKNHRQLPGFGASRRSVRGEASPAPRSRSSSGSSSDPSATPGR